jgi:hypothetical protein
MFRMLVVLAFLAACHPYGIVGYDAASSVSGPMSNLMNKSMATARTLSSAPAATTAATTESPTHTYSLGFGFGTKDFGAEIGVHEIGASSSLFDSGDSAQRYAMTTGSVDLRWSPIRWKHVVTYVHAGPSVGVLVDKGAHATTFGQGVRYGGGLAIMLPVVMIYVDASRTALQMSDGDAKGFNQVGGITVGIGIH